MTRLHGPGGHPPPEKVSSHFVQVLPRGRPAWYTEYRSISIVPATIGNSQCPE